VITITASVEGPTYAHPVHRSNLVGRVFPQLQIACIALLVSAFLISCGGGPSSSSQNPTVTSVKVALPPNQSMVRAGQAIALASVVQGTGAFNSAVTWSVNGVNGGDAANGTISAYGAYTAPGSLPSTNPVTIKATSTADPSKSGSVGVPVYTLTVTPSPASVYYNHTQQFTATVSGVSNPTTVWYGGYGTITDAGFYTAPTTMFG